MSNDDKILIPNTFQTPNALVDEVMPNVSGPAFKALLAITRLTLGWNHLGAVEISLDKLRKRTGLSRQGVIDGLRELKKLDLVIITKGPRNSRVPNHYALNLNLTTGELVHGLDRSKLLTSATSPQGRPILVHNSDSLKPRKPNKKESMESDKPIPSLYLFTNGASKNGVDEQLLNPTTKAKMKRARPVFCIPPELQTPISKVVARINQLAGTHYRDDAPDALSELIARLRAGATEAECIAVVEHQWRKWGEDENMRDNFNPVTLFRKSNFPRYLQNALRVQTGNSYGGFVG